MKLTKKQLRKEITNYFVDTTGLLAASTPIFAAMEVFASGMPIATSLETRLKITQLSFIGLGWAYGKGRDLSKKALHVTDESKKWKINALDIGYNVVFNIAISFPLYLSSGATMEEAMKGTAGAVALSAILGPVNGYSIDSFRDLAGTKASNRLPKRIREIGKKTKKALAVGLIGASIGLTAGIYKIKNHYAQEPQEAIMQTSKLEEITDKTYTTAF